MLSKLAQSRRVEAGSRRVEGGMAGQDDLEELFLWKILMLQPLTGVSILQVKTPSGTVCFLACPVLLQAVCLRSDMGWSIIVRV